MERSIMDNFDDHHVQYYIENEKRNSGAVNKHKRLAEDDYEDDNDLKKLKINK